MLKEIIDFKNSKEWADFEKYYNNQIILNQIGLFRYEDLHTNLLRSLFEENNVYGLGLYPIKKLFELIALKDGNNLIKNFIDSQVEISNLKVETQKCKNRTRVDLFISFKVDDLDYNIILENKICSEENETQCKEYYKVYGDNDNRNTYIYLSLEEHPIISSDKFICITYQDLIDYIIEPCVYRDKSTGLALSLYDYLKILSQLYIYVDDSISINNHQKLPITSYAKELTLNLWNAHSKMLIQLFQTEDESAIKFNNANRSLLKILSYNLYHIDGINEDIKNIILNYYKKRTIKYQLDNSKPYGKPEFIYNLLKQLIEEHKYEDVTDIPNEIRNCLGENWRIFVPEDDLDNVSHAYSYRLCKRGEDPLVLGNQRKLCYAWFVNDDDVKAFIDSVITVYPNYKERINII